MDVRKDSSLGNGHTGKELVQFLVIPDGQLQVPGDDAGLLVVAGGVTGQFKDFSGKILHDCGQVDWGAGTNTFGVVALAEEAVDSSHWKLEACTGRARLGLRLDLSTFASTGHLGEVGVVKVCLQRRSECDLNENLRNCLIYTSTAASGSDSSPKFKDIQYFITKQWQLNKFGFVYALDMMSNFLKWFLDAAS